MGSEGSTSRAAAGRDEGKFCNSGAMMPRYFPTQIPKINRGCSQPWIHPQLHVDGSCTRAVLQEPEAQPRSQKKSHFCPATGPWARTKLSLSLGGSEQNPGPCTGMTFRVTEVGKDLKDHRVQAFGAEFPAQSARLPWESGKCHIQHLWEWLKGSGAAWLCSPILGVRG